MTTYDANKDGELDAQELETCPALASAKKQRDINQDGALSADEIKKRFEAYESQSDYIAISLRVVRNEQPVANATVTMTPEAFIGADLQSYSGTTSDDGSVSVAPANGAMPGILPIGFYQVEISGATAGKQGCEIADDAQHGNRLEFSL